MTGCSSLALTWGCLYTLQGWCGAVLPPCSLLPPAARRAVTPGHWWPELHPHTAVCRRSQRGLRMTGGIRALRPQVHLRGEQLYRPQPGTAGRYCRTHCGSNSKSGLGQPGAAVGAIFSLWQSKNTGAFSLTCPSHNEKLVCCFCNTCRLTPPYSWLQNFLIKSLHLGKPSALLMFYKLNKPWYLYCYGLWYNIKTWRSNILSHIKHSPKYFIITWKILWSRDNSISEYAWSKTEEPLLQDTHAIVFRVTSHSYNT